MAAIFSGTSGGGGPRGSEMISRTSLTRMSIAGGKAASTEHVSGGATLRRKEVQVSGKEKGTAAERGSEQLAPSLGG